MRRLSPGEAKDLISQVPSLLQPGLQAQAPGPENPSRIETIEAELAQRLQVTPARAEQFLEIVATVLAESVSTGQMEDVQRQLPKTLRSVFAVG